MSAGGACKVANCKVRRATINDLDALVELCVEHAQYEGAAFDRSGVVDGLKRALISQPIRLHAWVATSGDGLIGYATATTEFSTWAAREYLHMDCLFVREGQRRAGAGAALLAAVVTHARKHHFAEIQWQTPMWNEDAARFYRRNGAVEKIKRRYFLDMNAIPPVREAQAT